MARSRWILLLVVAVAATFARALAGGYVYDDLQLVVANADLRGEHGAWAVVAAPLWGPGFPHWRPLTQVLLSLGHGIGGAAGIHALALLAHLAAVWLVFALTEGLTGRKGAAFGAALLFGVHPAQVESVAWCAALNDVLWGSFALAALLRHAKTRARGEPGPAWGTVACFALALAAKETALVVPLLVGWFDVAGAGASPRALGWRYARFLVVLVPWYVARVLVFGDAFAGFDRGPTLDPGDRSALGLAAEVCGRLVGVLAWPFAPHALRPVPMAATAPLFAVVAAVVAAAPLALLWRRARVPAFGVGVVVLVLSVHAANPRGLGEYPVADRYLYLAVAGASLAAVPALVATRFGTVSVTAVILACAWTSARAVQAWADQATFVRTQLAAHDDARVRYMEGQLALEAAPPDLDAAERALRRADELAAARRLGGEEARQRLQADIATGLAWCAFVREAAVPVPDFRAPAARFAAILRAHETVAPAHVGLAACLAELGDRAEAERHLRRALELDPGNAAARHNLVRLRRLPR
ncbi:MAG: tetratricopeptide repeat protein [Planctomycetota bacterium]